METTNFEPGASATNTGVGGSPPGNRFPISEQMKMTERFTRLNKDFLIYTITVDDPVVLTHSPGRRVFPLKLDNGFQILEYACTEDNNMIPHWISVTEAERANAAASGEKDNDEGTILIDEHPGRSTLGIGLALASVVPLRTLAAISDPVKTNDGLVSGVTLNSGVRAFKGIPFAAPPVGSLRWKEPQPATRWEGVRKADAFGNVCVHSHRSPSAFPTMFPSICRIRPR